MRALRWWRPTGSTSSGGGEVAGGPSLATTARRFVGINLCQVTNQALALAVSVLLARNLDTATFGALAFAAAVAGYAAILSRWGTESSLIRDLVRPGADPMITFAVSLRLRVKVASVPLLGTLLWVAIEPSLRSWLVLNCVAAALLLALDPAPLFDVRGSTGRHALLSTARQLAYSAAAAVLVVSLQPRLAALSFTAAQIPIAAGFLLISWKTLGLGLRDSFRGGTPRDEANMGRRNLRLLIAIVSSQVWISADYILIAALRGDNDLAPYAVAGSIATACLGAVYVLHRLLNPTLARALTTAKGARVLRRFLLLASLMSLVIGLACLVVGPLFIRLLYPDRLWLACDYLLPLSLRIVAAGPAGLLLLALLALGRDLSYQRVMLASAALNLTLNLMLIPEHAALGAAWTAAASMLTCGALAAWAVRDCVFSRHWTPAVPTSDTEGIGSVLDVLDHTP